MNKTSTKTLITLLVVLISFIFIVEFTSPIQSINIGHLQKRQSPAPSPDNPPPKDNPPPPPKDNPPPPKDNPPPPKDNPTPESPAPPKDNPTTAPQPAPETTPNPNVTPPVPDPNATPTPTPSPNTPAPDPNATPPTPDPNAPTTNPTPSPNTPAPNPNATPPTPDPNAPTTNPATTVVSITSDTNTNTVSPIVDSPVVTSSTGTNADTNAGPSSSPNSGVSSISSSPVSQSTTTSYPPGREPCTKADDPRCQRGTTDPTVVSTTEQNEIITQPSTPPAAPTKSQSQIAPNPKKSTITQFTTYTTTETSYFPGYSTVTSSKGTDGQLTTYATYIPPSTVVVVKKVTSAKVEEIQETNPSSAGHLDLELSVYNLYSVATSLFVIVVTMLYLIVA